MGPMSALIGLGALLGNKCGIVPMLLHRNEARWYWPLSTTRGELYDISGLDEFGCVDEVCLVLGMTGNPPALIETATSLSIPIIRVLAHDEVLGNGALGHPEDGIAFRHRMHELLHRLKDEHGVKRVHVLPCASNATCVFFGQAFDNFHPELLIYDFNASEDALAIALGVKTDQGKCVLQASTDTT